MNFLLAIPAVGQAPAFIKSTRLIAGATLALLAPLLVLGLWFSLQAKGRHDQKEQETAAAAVAISAADLKAAKATGAAATVRQGASGQPASR